MFNVSFQPEESEQVAVADYLRTRYPGVFFTISPANIKVSLRYGYKIKRMGYRAGTPDIMVLKPSGVYHALFIEMKAPARQRVAKSGKMVKVAAGKAQDNQIEAQSILTKEGYLSVICKGSEEAIKVIDEYLTARINQ